MVTKQWVKNMLTMFFNNLHKVAITGDYNDLKNKPSNSGGGGSYSGGGSNPIGTIINFYGLEAQVPNGYLICDGTEYLIEDYPILANHLAEIDTALERTDYVGSDSYHFKVPDLRGEFLRGTGTNGHSGQGSGSDVGIHQNATRHVHSVSGPGGTVTRVNNSPGDVDGLVDNSQVRKITDFSYVYNNSWVQYGFYSRPTNTSVLYCIKY